MTVAGAASADGVEGTGQDAGHDAGGSSGPRARGVPWGVVAALVVLPVLVLVVALGQRTWYPTGDQAQAELRMLSLPEDPPLLGAAGRIVDDDGRQGNHPGPLMFWATWPLYALLGGSSWAFEAATALVNVAWIVLAVGMVRRRAGPGVTLWFGLTTLVLVGGYGLDALTQPWNPWVALLPFTVLVLSVWATLDGERWPLVLAVAAGSYALQGHIGYLPLVPPLVLLAAVAVVWRALRTPPPERPDDGDADAPAGGAGRRLLRAVPPLVVALAVGLALWSGPLVDVATGEPTNVEKLLDNFASPDEEVLGLPRAAEAVLQASHPLGAWVWGGTGVEGSALPGAVLVGLWAAVAAAVAIGRRHASLTRLNAVVGLTLVVGTVAVSRVFGALYLYTFRWIVALVALMVFSLGWGVVLLVATRLDDPVGVGRRLVRPATAVGLAALALLSVLTSVRVVGQEIPYDQSWRMERDLARAVLPQLDPELTYLVRWDDPAYLGGLGFGLILALEREGIDVGADPPFSAAVEPHRVLCPGDHDAVLTVVTGERNIERYRAREDLVELAAADARSPEEVARGPEDEALLRRLLAERGQELSPDDLERVLNLILLDVDQPDEITDVAARLVLGGVPSAVFLDADPDVEPVVPGPLTEACTG